jgi:hypothetical protein
MTKSLKKFAHYTSSTDKLSPTVDWSHIQSLFERSNSDVLVLLDCCAAASSVPRRGQTAIEVIAACGFEGRAPPPGEHSFTTSLIEVLDDWRDAPSFSITMLHSAVLKVLMRRRKEKCSNGQKLEWRSTPVYVRHCTHPRAPGIELCKRVLIDTTNFPPSRPALQVDDLLARQDGCMTAATYLDLMSLNCTELDERLKISGQKCRTDDSASPEDSASDDDRGLKLPHMLVYITLDEDQPLADTDACRRWVSSFPGLARKVKVEGVYRSYSTVLLLSVPVVIWNMLPENPACQPITYVTSQNLMSDGAQHISCDEMVASETDSECLLTQSRSSSSLSLNSRPVIPSGGQIEHFPAPIQEAADSSTVTKGQETRNLFAESLPAESLMQVEALEMRDKQPISLSKSSQKAPSRIHDLEKPPAPMRNPPLPPMPSSYTSQTSRSSEHESHTTSQTHIEEPLELDEEFIEELEFSESPALLGTDALMRQLEMVDKLQDLGIDHKGVDLPRLVVCGNQSSGKSSVLGAITRIPFPRQAYTCTRFVTQIILRHDPLGFSSEVIIVPGRSREPSDKTRLEAFRGEISRDFSNLPAVINAATREIFRQAMQRSQFAEDILRIEIRGKDQQPLEIMDLPGLITNDNRNGKDVEAVARIVNNHIQKPRSIVLVVVGADKDLRSHSILQMIDQIPGCRERAFGIITKPDVPRAQNLETYINLASNKGTGYVYQRGWHVVRNSTVEELNLNETWNVRALREEQFFQTSKWKQLFLAQRPYNSIEQRLGISSLRKRVVEILSELNRREIPNLRKEIQKHLALLESRLRELGGERKPEDMKQRLVAGCRRLAQFAQDFSRGIYDSRNSIRDINDPDLLLRSRIRDLEDEFTWTIHNLGHTYAPDHFPLTTALETDDSSSFNGARTRSFPSPQSLSQREFYADGLRFLNGTRGEELPTYFDPSRISLLFQKQSQKWDDITSEFLIEFYHKCEDFLEHALRLEFPTETDVPGRLWNSFLGDNFAKRKEDAEKELQKLLYDRNRPVKTQSTDFITQTQNMRSSRIFSKFNNAVRDQLQSDAESVMDCESVTKKLGMLTVGQQEQTHAASFLDDMLLYYVVSILPCHALPRQYSKPRDSMREQCLWITSSHKSLRGISLIKCLRFLIVFIHCHLMKPRKF